MGRPPAGGLWARATISQATRPRRLDPRRSRFYDHGIETRGALYSGELPWATLQRVEETEEFFLFSISKAQAMYLPTRTLAAGDLSTVREVLRAGMNGRAKLRS